MKSTITVNGIEFILSASCVAQGVAFPSDKKGGNTHNKFRVSIKTILGRTSFDFYGSTQHFNNGVVEMEESDLKHALYCFVSDACSAKNSFENFCSEFGYDEDSRTAERTYKACVKSLEKYNRICSADIYDVVNSLND